MPDPREPRDPRDPGDPQPPAEVRHDPSTRSSGDGPGADGAASESAFPGRDRLLAALRRPTSRGQLIAAALLAVLGFAAAVQVRATGLDDDFAGARQQELISLINRLSLAADRAESEIGDLEQTRDALRNDALASQTARERARQEAETLGILAGTLPATGPGIRITVTDEDGQVGTDLMLNGIGELRDAGAEAIELNDAVRVVASTPVEDGSPGLVVGGVELQPPYSIDVIGDPLTLSSALDFLGGFTSEVVEVGGRVEVVQSGAIDVASTLPATDLEYAEPVPGE